MVKKVITALLLAFAGTSLAYLVVGEIRNKPGKSPELNGAERPDAPSRRTVVYYFHGNFRCDTCRKFEAYTDEAIREAFPAELKSGAVEWRIVNVEEPANEHFVKDYGLTTRQIILSDVVDGKEKRWKDLFRIWELVKDKQAYTNYVIEETRAYAEGRESADDGRRTVEGG